jgi:cytochrome b
MSHNPLGTLMVYNVWATLALITATGIMMGSDRFSGTGWVPAVHGLLAIWLLLSAATHVAAVLVDQQLSGVNLVRAMLTGTRRMRDMDG